MMNPLSKSLLKELLHIALDCRTGINAKEFRAKHEDHLDALDELEQGPYIEKRDNLYRLTLLALAELKEEDDRVETLLQACDQVFRLLRARYKNRTDAPVSLEEIIQETGIPEPQLRLVFSYLVDVPFPFSHNLQLASPREAWVAPGERILKYKTFGDVIEQLRDWASRSSRRGSPGPTDQSSKPLFLQEMTDVQLPEPSNLPKWYADLPTNIREMLLEVRYALKKELNALSSMGLRSVIDMICTDQVGDIGGFSQKLQKLEHEKLITPKNRQIIETALEVGHASVHRGYFPPAKDLQAVMDIVDHFVRELYVLGRTSESLKVSTPNRHITE